MKYPATIHSCTCTRCKKTKTPDEFYNDSRNKTGKNSWCKTCTYTVAQICQRRKKQ